MTNESKTELLLTSADAVNYVKRAPTGTRFCLHVRNNAPVVDAEGNATDRQFTGVCATYVKLSRADAVRILGDYLSEALQARGARISLTDRTYDTRRTIWIG
jgi:hypothetical protein